MNNILDVQSALSKSGYRKRGDGIYSKLGQDGWAFWIGYTGSKNPSHLLCGVCSREFFSLQELCMPLPTFPVSKKHKVYYDTSPMFAARADMILLDEANPGHVPSFSEIVVLIEEWMTKRATYTECLAALEAYCRHTHIYAYNKALILALLERKEENEIHLDLWSNELVGASEIVQSSIMHFISEVRKR